MLLPGTHTLPDGTVLRLRLPLASDRAALHELLAELGLGADDLEVRRALRCTPGQRFVVCATRWDGGRERLVGIGSFEESLTLIGPAGVTEIVHEALESQAHAWNRRVA